MFSPPVSIDRGSAENSSSSAFWITIDRPKVTTSEGSGSLPERAVEDAALQRVADAERDRQQQQPDGHQRELRRGHERAERRQRGDRAECAEHDEVALRGVGEPHHAEHQRLAEREQRVQAAEQQALDEDVDATRIGLASDAEVRLRDLLARERGGRAFERHAPFLEAVDAAATRAARARRPARR